MLLLSTQNNFYIILTSYVQEQWEKFSISEYHASGWFPISGCFFEKNTAEPILQTFPARSNFLESPFLGFVTVFILIILQESRKLRILISSVFGYLVFKNPPTILTLHYEFNNYFEILNFIFLIPSKEVFQPVIHYLQISSSRIYKLEKSCRFNLIQQELSACLANFEKPLFLICTIYHAEIFQII